jgi:phosphatidylglycerol:prolipoprotein diacylglycerol transferase
VHLGPFYVHFYALILLAGVLAGTWLTVRRAEKRGYTADDVLDALGWVVIPGLIGARLYHVLTPTPASGITTAYYLQHPLEILAVWNGGLGIYGAIIGGALGLIAYTRYKHYPLLVWLDLTVPGVFVGQIIGRWGNFVNQELYGAPTTLPWAIPIPPDKRLPGYEQYSTFHPLFLYESLWNLVWLAIILWIERRFGDRLRRGDLVLMYFICYGITRFTLDFVRLDSNGIGPLTTAQWVSLLIAVIAAGGLALRHLLTPAPAPEPPPAKLRQNKRKA